MTKYAKELSTIAAVESAVKHCSSVLFGDLSWVAELLVEKPEQQFSNMIVLGCFRLGCFVSAEQQLNCLSGELFTRGYFYSEGRLIVFQSVWKVFQKFCPLCNKQVIALSPRRIKDKVHFENRHENLSLILLGLVRLLIQNAFIVTCIFTLISYFSATTKPNEPAESTIQRHLRKEEYSHSQTH